MENLSINLQRKSRDKILNTNGYKLLDICKNNNKILVNKKPVSVKYRHFTPCLRIMVVHMFFESY